MMTLPVPMMREALGEYESRRKALREWLLGQLVEGVHYGTPPGIRVSTADAKAWRARPSLYKAGAEFIVDLMGLRSEFSADEETWRMLGERKNTFFRRCKLFSRSTGEFMGEGCGAREEGAKKMDINASLKMADKAALVAAVINTYGLSDVFTQDIEDAPPKGKTASRDGISPDELKDCLEVWKAACPGQQAADFAAFVASHSKVPAKSALASKDWTREDLRAVVSAIGELPDNG